MFDKELYPIHEEWEEYYKFLEALRRTGVVNMFGSGPYLQSCFPQLTEEDVNEIFCSWAANYKELSDKYDWSRDWRS